MSKTKVAIIGSGNIGTDLMIKIMRNAQHLEMGVMVGIDPASDGLARARRFGFETTAEGVDGLLKSPQIDEIGIVFDATSAGAHKYNDEKLRPLGIRLIDLTPAAIGPYVIPAVNLEQHLDAPNVNMVTCGGQATIPVVAAISRVVPVAYAEIVASIASKSAGPGTRANIDEFTETTSSAIVQVGGAQRGKAIIILNPAEPPLMMRDTVLALVTLPEGRTARPRRRRSPSRFARWSPRSRRTSRATEWSRTSRSPRSRPTSRSRRCWPRARPRGRPTRCRSSSRSRARACTSRRTPETSTS